MAYAAPILELSCLSDLRTLGFIVPSSNISVEAITTAILAQLPRVSVHYSRINVTTTNLDAGATNQFSGQKMVDCATLISHAKVEAIIWNGTSESWTGEGYEAGVRIQALIEKTANVPSSTSSLAQVEVLQKWGIKKMGLAVPYMPKPIEELYKYYKGCGVEIVRHSSTEEPDNHRIALMSVEHIKQLIRDADHPDAECVVVACTNLPAALVVEEMELELGKPIFDSIIVTLWKSLQFLKIYTPIHGWGRLLRNNAVLQRFDTVLAKLCESINGSRTTLRIDIPEQNCHVDRVIAESLKPGIPSLRPNTSLNQRALRTVIHLEKTHEVLVQCDTMNAAVQPPKILMSVYGVKAQILLPLVDVARDEVQAWISVHYVLSTRSWTKDETRTLHETGVKICAILHEAGWAGLQAAPGRG